MLLHLQGSLDCMHVRLGRLSKANQGVYKSRHGYSTMIVEAVASPSLHCTHLFVGTPGSNNDINVLHLSPLYHNLCNGIIQNQHIVCGHTFQQPYFLVDGIYPQLPIFSKPISSATSNIQRAFNQRHESCRKDVERLFGVVQSRWKILRSGGNRIDYYNMDFVKDIIKCCFILHNIIIDSPVIPLSSEFEEDESHPSHRFSKW